MKSIKILVLLLLYSLLGFAQSQGSSPRGTWGDWHIIYSEQPDLKVEISFNTSTCKNGSLTGYSFYRIRSNFNRPNAWIKFSFDAIGCDGLTHITPISYKLDKPGVSNNLGDWFSGYEVRRINGGICEGCTPKNKPLSNTDLIQAKQIFDVTGANYQSQLGKLQNQQIKQHYETTLQNYRNQFNSSYQQAQQYAQQGNAPSLASQLNDLQKINKQLKDNYNLMNDVVERQAKMTSDIKIATVIPPAAINSNKNVFYDNASAVQRTLDNNAPIRQEAAALIDKYLVDKSQLKDNPLAAASYEYAQKSLSASNAQDQNIYNLTSGVLGLLSLMGDNKPKQAISDEQSKQLTEKYTQKIDAARPYYLYLVNQKINDLLNHLKDQDMDLKALISTAGQIRELQQAQFDIKEAFVFVSVYDAKIEIPDLEKLIQKREQRKTLFADVNWSSFVNQNRIEQNGKVVVLTDLKEPKNVQQISLLRHDWHKLNVRPTDGFKTVISAESLEARYAAADYYFEQYRLPEAFKKLQEINQMNYTVERQNEAAVKESYAITEMYVDGKSDWKHRYYSGFPGLRKISASALLADMTADSAVASKEINKAGLALDRYFETYKWFENNIKTASSYRYNDSQYSILNAFFDNYIKSAALYINYSVNQSNNQRYTEQMINQLLSYVDYVSFYFKENNHQ